MENEIQPLPEEEIREQLRQIVKFHNYRRKGLRDYQNKLGIHAPDYDRSAHSSEIGKQIKARGIGVCGLTREEREKYGRIGGNTMGRRHYENKTGFFGFSEERRAEIQKKGAKAGGSARGPQAVATGQLDEARHIWLHVMNKWKPKKPCRFCNPPKDSKEPK